MGSEACQTLLIAKIPRTRDTENPAARIKN
jgi:hypothetical protein